MGENILGKNIQHMRKHYGETLDELGYTLNVARSTVSGYESGYREPTPKTLEKIAKHYGKTVDEMLTAKLYELDKFDSSQIVDLNETLDANWIIFPLIDSKEAYENDAFSKGITKIREMQLSLNRGETVTGSVIDEAMELFAVAIEADLYEAVANLLWCIFFLWSQQYTDLNAQLKLQTRLAAKQVDWKEMIYENKKNEKKSANKKLLFINDFDVHLNELIKTLKETELWAPLGDYYLALRYVLGLVDTGGANEMNQAVGMQMMISFAQLDNKYALDFIKVCLLCNNSQK